MDTAIQRTARRPRRRPPLRSYIPFAVFVLLCLALLSAVLWLLVSLLHAVTSSTPAATRPAPIHLASGSTHTHAPPSTNHPRKPLYTVQLPAHLSPTTSASTPTAAASTPTPVRSLMTAATSGVEITVTGPLPTRTPAPTPTAIGDASLVVARDVDLSGKPVEQARRFISPAMRLYAIVTLHTVHSADMLRFVFERNGMPLPNDSIAYRAGVDADVQSFSAWADYRGGHALPKGHYTVLFYRNGQLEAVTDFVVG